jgi:hypothetical protein
MSRTLRSAARVALVAAAAVASAATLALASPAVPASAEPRPFHAGQLRPDVMLTAAPAPLSCTVRPGVRGCTSFAAEAPGVLVAILYSEPWFRGTRVLVHLETTGAGCSARTSDDEGGGDLAGPLLAMLGAVRSVQTFHRCDVRLHEAFLDEGGTSSAWLHEVPEVTDLQVAAFTVS